MREIERKFLVLKLPELNNIDPIHYERYIINDEANKQVRIQKKDNSYELELKIKINDFEYEKTKKNISKSEFKKLSASCHKSIIRDSYLVNTCPNITIKKYFGDYEGLIRAEVEYENAEQMQTFKLPEWLGNEITGTNLGNDNKLARLSRNEFLKTLHLSILQTNIN